MPPNADTFSHGEHDNESALHSDWGSNKSIRESLGDGGPREDLDEPQDELQAQDVQDHHLFNESGAHTPDSSRQIP